MPEQLAFYEIIQDREDGIIPLFIEGTVQLIFWKKLSDGRMVGCLINREYLTNKISRLLPKTGIDTRLLTILNEHSRPIAMSSEQKERDWRQTFISKEISRVLPNWKIAVYFLHPENIFSQAAQLSKMMRIVTFIMLLVIAFGGILVVHLLMEKVQLAQQRAAFATNVSHELKTPLTSIRIFTELLLENKNEFKKNHYLQIILAETERLSRLINNVLDFSHPKTSHYRYQIRTFDLDHLCREIMETQRVLLESKGFTIIYQAQDNSVNVQADPEAIKQVLLNLLSNDEKYSRETKEITLHLRANHDWVFIDVVDKGIGIAESEKEKIFKEFYRVDDKLSAKTQGTGLGLTIARKIVRDHKGEIRCIIQTQGSLFRVQLPLQKKEMV